MNSKKKPISVEDSDEDDFSGWDDLDDNILISEGNVRYVWQRLFQNLGIRGNNNVASNPVEEMLHLEKGLTDTVPIAYFIYYLLCRKTPFCSQETRILSCDTKIVSSEVIKNCN